MDTAKKVKPSPATKKPSKVRLVKKKAAITLKVLPVAVSCAAGGLPDAEIRALKIRLTATEAQVLELTEERAAMRLERAAMRLAQQTAESERAAMTVAQHTAESERAAMTVAQHTAESERVAMTLAQVAMRLELQQHLDTQVQSRRRLFELPVGDADPQPLQAEVPIPAVTGSGHFRSEAIPRPSHTPDAPTLLRAVSAAREDKFFEDCFRSGQHRPEKFAGDMFMAMLPFHSYETMAKVTNWSGSKGKMPLPLNVRQTLESSVSRRFPGLTTDQWYKIRNRVNERLRSPRKTDPETPRPGYNHR
ncbi:uncharacterized protein LOC117472236 [Trematomus bernacchii]|uniref:uncharacterized protein LOC117472236 n=1 Tax=Trematomus bernacchii TaxID=40690 RepID=UPI001469A6D0|nr:uncharacterized protein LOC117472236 [Trematomus bernacchii]